MGRGDDELHRSERVVAMKDTVRRKKKEEKRQCEVRRG